MFLGNLCGFQMPTRRPSRLLVVLAFAAVYILWGSTYLGIRLAIETLPGFLMAGDAVLARWSDPVDMVSLLKGERFVSSLSAMAQGVPRRCIAVALWQWWRDVGGEICCYRIGGATRCYRAALGRDPELDTDSANDQTRKFCSAC